MKKPKKYFVFQFEADKEITTNYPPKIMELIASGDYARLDEICEKLGSFNVGTQNTNTDNWIIKTGNNALETELGEIAIIRNCVFTGRGKSSYLTKIIFQEKIEYSPFLPNRTDSKKVLNRYVELYKKASEKRLMLV
jgi:hypothetical protein